MKKLAFLVFLTLAAPLYADTQTTGSMALLKISTNAVDKNRSWGDKINENFQIIDSTVTAAQTSIVGVYATIISTKNALYVAINSTNSALYTAINSTNTGLYTAINSTNTSLYLTVYSTYVALTSTGTSLSYLWTVSKSSWDAFTNFTSTTQAQFISLNSTVTAISNSTSTLATTLSQRTQVWNNGGTPLVGGNVTSVNCVGLTCTQSGSTVTATATAGGSSGPRTQLLTVGTSTVKGADCVVTGSESFDAMYASVGARGLLQTSTVAPHIFFQEGIYGNIGPAVIPFGASVYGAKGSSVVWYPSGTGTMLTVHGSIDNIIIDAQGRAVSAFFIKVGSSGYIGDGVKVINAQNFDQTTTAVSIFGLNNTTGAYVGASVDGHVGCVQDNLCGGLIDIQNSQSCLVNIKEKNGGGSTSGKQHLYVGNSTDIVITGDYQSLGERPFATFGGNTRVKIMGRWKMARATNTGMFFFRNLSFQISTGMVISAEITIEIPMTQPVIQLQAETGLIVGPLVTNTYVYDYGNASIPAQFINIPSGVFGTIVTDTHIFGLSTLCSDAGTGTNCSGNGNTINNKAAP